MKDFIQDVGSYVLHFTVFYLISCLVLGPLFVLMAVAVMTVRYFAFGLAAGGGEDGDLLGVGIGMSIAFVISLPIALAATIWAAPNDRNLKRDYERFKRRMGPPQPGQAPRRDSLEEFS